MIQEAPSRKNRIAFGYLGGKYYHLDWLLPLLECTNAFSFVELFAGSFVVSLNIKQHRIMTANDINQEVINFFQVLRENPEALIHSLQLTPYAREEYLACKPVPQDHPVEKARKFFVRAIQSKFSMGAQTHSKGWACTTKDSRATLSEYINRWLNKIEGLAELVNHLKLIQIENRDFRNVIANFQGPRTLIYADPPYHSTTNKGSKEYRYKMTDNDHIDLANLLHEATGYKAVSGYECDLMKDLYPGWFITKAPVSRRNISKSDRQECLWTNYDPKKLNKLTLF